ncbi:hypothetical protein VTO73DRAFT_1977 [Trametes versicolor]
MDTLPLETLQQIFALACTDGGFTGCSLSLTSKAVRAAVRTIRFHSVSLVAYPARLDSFVGLYAQECDPTLGDIPKVQHLRLVIPPSQGPSRFICGGAQDMSSMPHTHSVKTGSPNTLSVTLPDAHLSPPVVVITPSLASGSSSPTSPSRLAIHTPSSRSASSTRTSSPVEPVSSLQLAEGGMTTSSYQAITPNHYAAAAPSNHAPVELDLPHPDTPPHAPAVVRPPSPSDEYPQIVYTPEYREAMHTLSRLVAPHLETLVIQRGFKCQVRLLSPALAFLDMPFPRVREVALLGLSDVGELVVPHANVAPLFPAATRLHLVRKGLAGHDCMDFWRVHAPHASHLRVSCLRAPFGKFMPSLANSLGIAHLPDLPPPRRRVYPTLRAIILHQDPPTELEQQRVAALQAYALLSNSFAHFQNACPDQGVKIAVAPPFYMHFEDWDARLHEEWLERMVGGPGCWKELEPCNEQSNMEAT